MKAIFALCLGMMAFSNNLHINAQLHSAIKYAECDLELFELAHSKGANLNSQSTALSDRVTHANTLSKALRNKCLGIAHYILDQAISLPIEAQKDLINDPSRVLHRPPFTSILFLQDKELLDKIVQFDGLYISGLKELNIAVKNEFTEASRFILDSNANISSLDKWFAIKTACRHSSKKSFDLLLAEFKKFSKKRKQFLKNCF